MPNTIKPIGTPPQPGPSPGVFDVRSFGANPGDGYDDAPAINAAVDAANARSGGVVYCPGGPYTLGSPIVLKSNVVLRGDSRMATHVRPLGYYAGPLVMTDLGTRPGQFGANYRPSAAGILDASVGARCGVASCGNACLAITGHPFQFGAVAAGKPPDHWGGGGSLCVDFILTGGPWPDATPLAGTVDPWGAPAPWVLRALSDGFALDVSLAGGTNSLRVHIPAPTGGTRRVSAQFNLDVPRCSAWVDRKQVTTAFMAGWQSPSPGMKMAPHDGVTAFMMFYVAPRSDNGPASPADATFYGFRVSRAELYDPARPAQTLIASPSLALNDNLQFFDGSTFSMPTGSFVACLPLTDPAGPPWVDALADGAGGLMFWMPPLGFSTGQNIAIEDMSIDGRMQPGIMATSYLDLRMSRVTSTGGSQGLGTIPRMNAYTTLIEDCQFGGYDAAAVHFWQNVTCRNLEITGTGREGIRAVGSGGLWEDTFVGRTAVDTQSIFRFTAAGDGMGVTLDRATVDNESGQVLDAVVRVDSGWYHPTVFTCDSLNAGIVADPSCLIRLTSPATNPAPARATVTNPATYGTCPTAIVASANWTGSFDASLLGPAVVTAPSLAVARPVATPPG